MTKPRPPARENNDDLPETRGNPNPIAANDYFDPAIHKSFSSRRGNKRQLTPAQKQSRKIFFISQAKKAKSAGKSLSDYLAGNQPVSVNQTDTHNPTRYGSTRVRPAHGKHTLSSSESDPEEGPAPKQQHVHHQSSDSNSSTHSDQEMAAAADEAEQMELQTMSFDGAAYAAAQNTAGVGASGGGGGVGESTGSWSCETVFGAKSIKTTASRHCICLVRNGHAYNAIGALQTSGSAANGANSTYVGVSTPWNYIDFNQMDIFFSPQEMQKLVNTAKRWRPTGFTVEIFNLQIVQKVLQTGTQTSFQYNNDLTSTIQVFADSSRMFPILSYPNQSTVMSPFPNDIYTCPQYAYLTNNDYPGTGTSGVVSTNAAGWKLLNGYSKFYVLDKHPSAMLRTGNNWSSHFEFGPSMGWFDNTRLNVPIHRMMNPLYDTYQVTLNGQNAKIGSFDQWRQPFHPGPFLSGEAGSSTSGSTTTAINNYLQPSCGMYGNSYVGTAPGPAIAGNSGQGATSQVNTISYLNKTTGYSISNVGAEITEGNLTTYSIPTPSLRCSNPTGPIKYPAAQANAVGGTGSTGSTTASSAQSYSGIMPGMVWDKRPLHSRMCIWQRVPNTESGFEPGSELGGIPTRNAPGHIFLRLTPKPTDTANEYINEFATFTIKVTMNWEVEWDSDYAWNPKNLFSWSTSDAQTGAYWPSFDTNNPNYNMNHIILGKQLARGN
ncbi:MAG: structural protein [Ara ararauna aveparvovirus]|uniref:Structural protein n=2 Tax=Parvoviridae TaxID=10780 RepID=A0A7D3QJ68_9VIRU|nr:MAG: structural protein [Parvoviridae sp.]QTE03874.1 MAG: structural protein [Ara ararauna aveparvovirus]